MTTGVVTTLVGSAGGLGSTDGTGSSARFNHPLGIVSDRAGSLYVADSTNDTVRKITVSSKAVSTAIGVAGRFGVFPGPLPGQLAYPTGLSILPSGELVITDGRENAVLVAKF